LERGPRVSFEFAAFLNPTSGPKFSFKRSLSANPEYKHKYSYILFNIFHFPFLPPVHYSDPTKVVTGGI
jgi:hypothetical protein